MDCGLVTSEQIEEAVSRAMAEVDRAMKAAKEVLDSVGATWTDVVKITKYLTDIRDMGAVSKALGKALKGIPRERYYLSTKVGKIGAA